MTTIGDDTSLGLMISSPLLGPSVKSFTLHSYPWKRGAEGYSETHEETLSKLLVDVDWRASFTHFSLEAPFDYASFLHPYLGAILASNKDLQSFRVNFEVDGTVLRGLGALPRLQKLDLGWIRDHWPDMRDSEPKLYVEGALPVFHQLNDVSVSLSQYPYWVHLLTGGIQILHTSVGFSKMFTERDLATVAFTISSSCPQLGALTLHFDDTYDDAADEDAAAESTEQLEATHLEPLYGFLECKMLREFCVDEWFPDPDLQDSHIEAMARSWPLLQVLRLRKFEMTVEEPEAFTLATLVSIARNCEDIREIVLPAWSTDTIPSTDGIVPSGKPVILDVAYFKSDCSALKLGRFLGSLWSQLKIRKTVRWNVPPLNDHNTPQYVRVRKFCEQVERIATGKVASRG